MSADTYDCEKCGAIVFTNNRAHHEVNLCKELQRKQRKRAYNADRMRKKRRALPTKRGKLAKCALDGCGEEFASQGVKHLYCCSPHADLARKDEDAEAEATARLAREMEPLKREEELVRLAAEAVPVLSPEVSFALWLRCLGVTP
jgi:hypothetical protein